MEVEINMINVEDGDAILIMLKDKTKKFFIVIDGGYKEFYEKRLKKRIDEILVEFEKIDLLICTHYDDDHITGTLNIVKNYHKKINEIWIHLADNRLYESKNKIFSIKNNIKSQNSSKEQDFNFFKLFENYNTLSEFKELVKKINSENKIQQVTKDYFIDELPEFKVISPTVEYYNTNLDTLKNQYIKTKLECYINENITATNKVSIVTLLSVNNKKYLFTGDAGIETFEETPGWEKKLNDLFFLDLPHHGSKNNTSEKMINVFNPEIVFVSASNNCNRPCRLVKKYLEKSCGNNFHVTNSEENTWYLKIDNSGSVTRVKDK